MFLLWSIFNSSNFKTCFKKKQLKTVRIITVKIIEFKFGCEISKNKNKIYQNMTNNDIYIYIHIISIIYRPLIQLYYSYKAR